MTEYILSTQSKLSYVRMENITYISYKPLSSMIFKPESHLGTPLHLSHGN